MQVSTIYFWQLFKFDKLQIFRELIKHKSEYEFIFKSEDNLFKFFKILKIVYIYMYNNIQHTFVSRPMGYISILSVKLF